ncbi:MAG: Na+/H+ antiporter NhaA [Bacteroidales bacterium]|nr:Na+/H+ antiporter NhaA [Bacteroidales bacterium]
MIKNLLISPFQKFVKIESLSGIMLFGATIIAMILANSSFAQDYESIWQYEIGIKTAHFELSKPLLLWINDGLMAIFFFLIGLEIKREVMIGDLNDLKKASFPIFAALGGMIVPISIYVFLNSDPATSHGWGIPAATDIAFSLAILQLLGKRVPISLKVFLAAFAIVDDIGAVILIAVFYSTGIKWLLLIIAIAIVALLIFLSKRNIYSKYLFFAGGVIVWLLFLKAGFHPTVAGVLLAFTIPLRQKVDVATYADNLCDIVADFKDACKSCPGPVLTREQVDYIDDLEDWTNKVQSPLQHLEHNLHNWVAYFVIPIFAFANAGVTFKTGGDLNYTLIFIIMISLFAGKSIGVTLITWLATKLKLTAMPGRMKLSQLVGVSFLAGVGFTMSIFISNLAFVDHPEVMNSAKIGIISGSLLSGITGFLILRLTSKKEDTSG